MKCLIHRPDRLCHEHEHEPPARPIKRRVVLRTLRQGFSLVTTLFHPPTKGAVFYIYIVVVGRVYRSSLLKGLDGN